MQELDAIIAAIQERKEFAIDLDFHERAYGLQVAEDIVRSFKRQVPSTQVKRRKGNA